MKKVVFTLMLLASFCFSAYAETEPPQTFSEAMRWYKEAAKEGNPRAQFLLGLMYHNGIRVGRDLVEAERWYRAAALKGHSSAQLSLAVILHKGEISQADPTVRYAGTS